MNKKIKLGVLASPRCTRSMKKQQFQPATASRLLSNTSQYFVDKKKPGGRTTKRKHVQIKYENEPTATVAEAKAVKKEPQTVAGTNVVKIEPETFIETNVVKKEPNIDMKVVKEEGGHEIKNEGEDSWEPKGWRTIMNNIREMRKLGTAPVDDMGCHKCADPTASPSVIRFQALVALMLSSQTRDQVTHAAMQRLNVHGCTPDNIIATPDDTLSQLIYPVSFYKRKVGYIKRTANILNEQYGGDIPNTLKELCKLPGVGPKMGHICMQVAWGQVSGIGVDTHVHRISNRLGWVEKPTKTPEQTRALLEKWLPREEWTTINHLLVGFGQEICTPVRPKCGECLNLNICPYAHNPANKARSCKT